MNKAIKIIKEIYADGYNFHPDDDFRDYINYSDGTPISPSEADRLNKKVDELWCICNECKLDIYELCLITLKQYYYV